MNHRILLILLFTLTSTVFAADPPLLRRNDAKKILENMEWKDVNIVTIQQGVNTKGVVAPIYATIVALGNRDSKNQQITQNVSFDEEHGWFFYELTEKGARLWNKEGYREMRFFGTW
jgi:hypothetical protein